MWSQGERKRRVWYSSTLQAVSLSKANGVCEVMWKRPILWISADEILPDFCWAYFLIAYHLRSANYFPLNKVLVTRALLLHRFFHELLSLCLLKLHLTLLSSLCRWKIGGWVDTLSHRQRISALWQWRFAVAQPCELLQFLVLGCRGFKTKNYSSYHHGYSYRCKTNCEVQHI